MAAINKPKIPVADDEEVIADTLAMILTQSGFTAHAVYSGERAIEMAVSFLPDMLISDVFMTGITGIEAATEIRTALPSCKILLFSGQAATNDLLQEAHRGHNFEMLAKPIHPKDLLAKLRNRVSKESSNHTPNFIDARLQVSEDQSTAGTFRVPSSRLTNQTGAPSPRRWRKFAKPDPQTRILRTDA